MGCLGLLDVAFDEVVDAMALETGRLCTVLLVAAEEVSELSGGALSVPEEACSEEADEMELLWASDEASSSLSGSLETVMTGISEEVGSSFVSSCSAKAIIDPESARASSSAIAFL